MSINITELTKSLCAMDGVSGCEDEVRDYISEKLSSVADEIRTDAIGNLLVFRKGKTQIGKTIMLCAHMDEVGLIIKSITDEGYLKFAFVGGIDRRVIIGKPVRCGAKKIPGVIGIKAYHLVSKEEEEKVPKAEDMYIDIGATDKAEAEKLIVPGDVCAFMSEPACFGQGFVKAKAIDDRIGCAVLLALALEQPPVDTWFAFTAQEEVGARGAFGASFSLKPDIAIVVEGTTAADIPGVDEHKTVCAPGKGPVLPFMDGSTIYDRGLFEALCRTAEQSGIAWQTKQFISGGTDASSIQRSREGVRVCAVSAALRYIHSPACVGAQADFEAMYALIKAYLYTLGGTKNA